MTAEDFRRSIPFWLFCIFLIVAVGCRPANTEQEDPVRNAPAQPAVISPQTSEPQAAMQNPVTEELATGEGDQMPVFLEVIQTTSLGKSNVQSPVIGVGPVTYFYNPDSKILALDPRITLEPATELIVGVNEVLQTPGQTFEKKEIVQNPPAQPALIQIVARDRTSDILTIVFAGEKFNLAPGEKRSFKKPGSDSNAPAVITIISNYGRPIEIQSLSSDGSSR
jgi:hypothetical protein